MPASAPTERPASIAHDATRDPAAMTPEQRRREVAAILARGVLRLRECQPLAVVPPPERTIEKSSKSLSIPLDVHAGTRLHVVERTACRQAADAGKERQP